MKKLLLIVMTVFLFSYSVIYAENEKSLLEMIEEITNEGIESADNNTNISINGSEPVDEIDDPAKIRNITIMIYLCGSTLEEETASATRDIAEMINSGFDPENVNVIIMAGGSRKWLTPAIPNGTSGIYQLDRNGINKIFNDGNAYNMGDPMTLAMFLNESYRLFRTERYALIIWDHGGGSINGICQDENYNHDSLTMAELKAAFDASPFAEQKLDWIGFDACLMGSAETAKVLAPYAHYMIASEDAEPANGWNYYFLKDLDKDITPVETGKRIIETYNSMFRQNFGFDAYMSCICLDNLNYLIESIDDYFTDLKISDDNFAEMSRARRGLISFGRNIDSMREYDLVDLGHMVKTFSKFGNVNKAEKVLNAIDETVTDYISESSNATGLSVYFPFYNKYQYPKFMDVYSTLDFSTPYEEFITAFGKYLVSSGNNTWSVLSTIHNIANRAVHYSFQLNLTEEQIAEIGTASLVVLNKTDEGLWQLIRNSNLEIKNGEPLTGEFVNKGLFFTDSDNSPINNAVIVYEDLDDNLVRIPVVLVDKTGAEFDAVMVCYGNIDEGIQYIPPTEENHYNDGSIVFYLFDEAINSYSPRLIADPSQYSSMKYFVPEKEMTFENGTLLSFDQWNVVNTALYVLSLEEPWKIKSLENQLDEDAINKLYVAFQITDIYNDMYTSEPEKLISDANPNLIGLEFIYEDSGLLQIESAKFDSESLRVSAAFKNISDTEAFIVADNFTVNNDTVDLETEIYGTGASWGLIPGESQPFSVLLPVSEEKIVTEITFDLTFYDPNDEILGVVPVKGIIRDNKDIQ